MPQTRRATRPAHLQARAFRVLVPVMLGTLAVVALVVAALAAAVLLGFISYPGK